jgi:ligand-binding sensor domain-containing protein/serine phosphatase RsbU (regulator of sigma subunit)
MNKSILNSRNTLIVIFSFFISMFSHIVYAQNNSLSTHLKPLRVLAKEPRTIRVPISAGGSYTTHIDDEKSLIHLLPPKRTHGLLPNGNFTTFNTEDGLALSSVSCGYLDRSGYLWFGTFGGGVSRYDGKKFTNFTSEHGLVHNTVLCITEDRDGNMWFGTDGEGLVCYNGKMFVHFAVEQGISHGTIWSVIENKEGDILFGTDGNGLGKIDMNMLNALLKNSNFNSTNFQDKYKKELSKCVTFITKKNGLPDDAIWNVKQDRKGNIWLGTESGGLSCLKYTDKTISTFSMDDGLPSNTIWNIAEDHDGNIWIGTSDSGVSCYNGKEFRNFTTEEGLAGNSIWDIMVDKSGYVWLGTDGGGASRYDGKGFVNFTSEQGLSHNGVFGLVEDRTGSIWFCTDGGGVSRYDGDTFSNFTTKQGLAHNSIMSVTEDRNGRLWFGSYGGGVTCFDGEDYTTYTVNQGLGHNTIFNSIEDKKGNLWFASYGGGVSCFDGETFKTYTTKQGLADNTVWCILEDKKGNLWFGTAGGGVSMFDGSYFTTYGKEQGLTHENVFTIAEDEDGVMWFGTLGGGISRFDGTSFLTLSVEHGLANSTVFNLFVDRHGDLLCGTDGSGVSVLSSEHKKLLFQKKKWSKNDKLFTTISRQDGLGDLVIYDMVEMSNGNIVFGTNLGYSVLVGGVLNLFNGVLDWKYYNKKHGFPIKDINTNAMCVSKIGLPKGNLKGKKGLIWAGCGDDKVVLYNPHVDNRNDLGVNVLIESIKINEERISWYALKRDRFSSSILNQQELMVFNEFLSESERSALMSKFSAIEFEDITRFYSLPTNLVLPYENNSISFDFVGIETSRNFMVQYQYRLEGYDRDWSPVTTKNTATFGNIYEGTYTFKLRAKSPEGVWSETVEFSFRVLPPWWRTWWMYVVYGVLLLVFLWFMVWLYGRNLRARAKELKDEVNRATVEIVKQKEEVEKTHAQLTENHKQITDSILYAKRIQNSILPSIDSIYTTFKDSFLIYLPKNVVAGDFYWLEKYQNGRVYFAVADCTGHGVPGALVSIVCSNALSKALLEENICDTGRLLDRTRELVTKRFDKSGEKMQDGMDISLCALDLKTRELQWSGANNPLWIMRKDELIKYKPDKMPIGKYEVEKPFVTHEIQLKEGDVIYLFSDGFQDQFGGEKDKKFSSAKLESLLVSLQNSSLDEQEKIILNTFVQWKGDLEQLDDVCLLGVKV